MRIIKILIASTLFALSLFFIWPNQPSTTTTLSIMTFNIENGGTQIDFNKVVEAIKHANADVVGLQEAWGHTSLLASKLGWRYYNNQQHIISRYPLHNTTDSHGLYTLIEVTPGHVVAMANMHLPDDPYGPDLAKQGANKKTIIAAERARLATALPFIKTLATLAQRGVPVFLTGDFNSPSHLDWKHRPVAVEWPVTKSAEQYGLIDAYYQMHPHHTVTTWPSGRPVAKHSYDGFNPSAADLPDRIDFIFSGGDATVLSAEIVAEPNYQSAPIKISPWPSDHRAVVARFKVSPAALTTFELAPSAKAVNSADPNINVTKRTFKRGESILISWHNTPGNRYDYIMIIPTGSKKTAWGEAVRLYTHGQVSGSILYNKTIVKGNWLNWHTASEGHWPLKPGHYDIRLMLDDGNKELAKQQIVVTP